jgi:(5-formylfuran-3-yl)methyl phosphate synthase
MQLLVSVRSPLEALSALEGGADIIDAKEPDAGALGAVSLETFGSIVERVAGRVPVSAALGEARDGSAIDDLVQAFARAGATFVKIGFAGVDRQDDVIASIADARRGAADTKTAVVAVAYADYQRVDSLRPDLIAEGAAAGVAQGVLLDTCDKDGPGLLQLVAEGWLREWVDRAQSAGLFVALAGQLRAPDLTAIQACHADIVGVRGAVCDGGRIGTISAERVHLLSATLRARMESTRRMADVAAAPGQSSHPQEHVLTRPEI